MLLPLYFHPFLSDTLSFVCAVVIVLNKKQMKKYKKKIYSIEKNFSEIKLVVCDT